MQGVSQQTPSTQCPFVHSPSAAQCVACGEPDVAIVEIGGTVGDIESLPFLEAIRQMGVELGRNACVYMHLTLVPTVGASEIKTKPTQHSVKELREIGIQPDVLLCRGKEPLPDEQRRAVAGRVIADETYDDLARREGLSPSAMRVAIHTACSSGNSRPSRRSDSMTSPTNSSRTGCDSAAG